MKGIKFPLTVDPVRKNLVVVDNAELFRGHILSYLQTVPRERVMQLRYGLTDYLFQSIPSINVIAAEVKAGLEQYVPDCEFDVYGDINDQGGAVITVYWAWRGEDQLALQVTL